MSVIPDYSRRAVLSGVVRVRCVNPCATSQNLYARSSHQYYFRGGSEYVFYYRQHFPALVVFLNMYELIADTWTLPHLINLSTRRTWVYKLLPIVTPPAELAYTLDPLAVPPLSSKTHRSPMPNSIFPAEEPLAPAYTHSRSQSYPRLTPAAYCTRSNS